MSDNGEQWSPNTPPPATAPKHAYTNVPSSPPVKVNASGSAIGIQIAKVPQEDPVANAIIADCEGGRLRIESIISENLKDFIGWKNKNQVLTHI